MNLTAFLKENALKQENVKYVASKRFLDDEGKPIEWELCPVTSEEDEKIRRNCSRKVPAPGKRNQFTEDFDYNRYLGLLTARCTVFPNLNAAELQDNYGVMGADQLLKVMLMPGEYADYLKEVQKINGFESSMEELVDEAKN